jgi:hypothetical protein
MIMDAGDFEQMIAYLKENLRLNIRTSSEYTGGMCDSGNLYEDVHTVQLILDGEIISEVTLS